MRRNSIKKPGTPKVVEEEEGIIFSKLYQLLEIPE
jgi:hypothetical protein